MRPRGTTRDAAIYRSGRLLAIAVLGVLLLLRAFDPPPVATMRLQLFDAYQRLEPAAAAPSVLIVDIDDASLARYGQWPWPRNLMAKLIDALAASGARLVGMDVLFAEPDRLSAQSLIDSLPAADAPLRRAFEALPDGDLALAASFRRVPVVLGAAVDGRAAAATAAAVPAPPPLIERGADPRPALLHYDRLVRNLDVLGAASAGTGVVSLPLESDGVVRRIPAVIAAGDVVLPSLAVEMARLAAGGGALTIEASAQGVTAIELPGGGRVPTDRQGRVWIHYAPSDPARYVSAAKLLADAGSSALPAGRLILVGATAAGLMDLHPTPLGTPLPGVEIHAQLLENLLGQRVLSRPALATLGELAFALAFGMALIFLQPRLTNRWLLLVWAAASTALLYAAWIAYSTHRILLDGVFPALVVTVVYVVIVAASFIAARRHAEATLRERERHLRALQAELLDVSRRSAVAQLSSALAHELNQPLSAIGNYVQACRRMLVSAEGQASDKIYGYMDRAVAQVDRAAAIITGLRDIVETGHTVRAPEQLNPVLEEAAATALLSPAAGAVALRQRYADGLPRVAINRIQIQQVVLNLVRNAIEAMAGMKRRELTIESRAAADGGAEVRIRDTGPGLAPEVEARLFRPVVSSKEAGMGVGLSISRSIIEAHGGRLWATRNAEGGMTFHFTLPPAESE
jgi:CHASE2 domain-containing sensor protein/nitrogen-specific signal transduction histidine kinase